MMSVETDILRLHGQAAVEPAAIRSLWQVAGTPALTTTGDPGWDVRMATWLRLDGLARADEIFGAFGEASRVHALTIAGLLSEPVSQPPGINLIDADDSRMAKAEAARLRDYLQPAWQAAADLVNTPAPTMAAALFKIELVARDELHFDPLVTRDCMEIVNEDLARLAAADHDIAEAQ